MALKTITEIKKGQTGTGLLIESDGYMYLDKKDAQRITEGMGPGMDGARNVPFPFIVSAVFQKFGIENANGRIYSESILKREVEKYQQAIEEKRAYGECNHPESSAIDVERIAINIIELHWEGNTLVGKIEIPISEGFRKFGIVSTLADLVAQWLISGLKIGVSSRGLGTVTKRFGKIIVEDDFELVCWDVVAQPSTPGAWIGTDEESIRPYVESEVNKKPVISEDKYSKFDKWLSLKD